MGETLSTIIWQLVAVAFLVSLNGFFVATEFALVSIRQSRIEELVASGVGAARAVERALKDLDRYIAGTQTGITIVSLALGWIGEPAVALLISPLFRSLPAVISPVVVHGIATAVAFILITCVHVVLGELVPKALALQKTEQVALFVSSPMKIVVSVFQPLILALNGMGNAILRLMGLMPARRGHSAHTVEELQILVRQSHEAGVLDDLERRMLQRSLRFSELVASDIMVPRLDIIAYDINLPADVLMNRIAATTHARIPMFEESIDNVIGVLHVQALFRYLHEAKGKLDLRKLLRPVLVVPATIPLDALFVKFRQQGQQIAVVVDEYGSTAGLVTLEDVVSQVFGDVHQGIGPTQGHIHKTHEGRVFVRGDVRLHELNEALGWNLVDKEADTIAGYMMDHLGRIAKVGDRVSTPYGVLRVVKMARLRIMQVEILRSDRDERARGDETDKKR